MAMPLPNKFGTRNGNWSDPSQLTVVWFTGWRTLTSNMRCRMKVCFLHLCIVMTCRDHWLDHMHIYLMGRTMNLSVCLTAWCLKMKLKIKSLWASGPVVRWTVTKPGKLCISQPQVNRNGMSGCVWLLHIYVYLIYKCTCLL